MLRLGCTQAGADLTRSPKQGNQWPHETDLCSSNIKKGTSLFTLTLAHVLCLHTFSGLHKQNFSKQECLEAFCRL